MRGEAGLRKCKARGGEEMGLSAGISVDSVFSWGSLDSAKLEI